MLNASLNQQFKLKPMCLCSQPVPWNWLDYTCYFGKIYERKGFMPLKWYHRVYLYSLYLLKYRKLRLQHEKNIAKQNHQTQ